MRVRWTLSCGTGTSASIVLTDRESALSRIIGSRQKREEDMNILIRAPLAIAVALAMPSLALAHEQPTCSEFGLETHAQHIIGDYVTGLGGLGGGLDWPPAGLVGNAIRGMGALVPGGPGPGFHFEIEGLPPGASFCIPQAHPNGFNTPDTRGAPRSR
jgi:hypothetical protein